MVHTLDLMVPASKILTVWAKSYGGPEGGPEGPPRWGDFWMKSHPLLELHPVTVVGHQRGYRGGVRGVANLVMANQLPNAFRWSTIYQYCLCYNYAGEYQ